MTTVVVSDTSCLIILEKIGHLSLLKESYEKVLVTPTVVLEFVAQLPDWIVIRAPALKSLQRLLEEKIDPGESSSIALAAELPDCTLILDDLRARKVAADMGLVFTGTLGIIANARRRGLIPAARPLLEQIKQTDFRISNAFIEAILEELGE